MEVRVSYNEEQPVQLGHEFRVLGALVLPCQHYSFVVTKESQSADQTIDDHRSWQQLYCREQLALLVVFPATVEPCTLEECTATQVPSCISVRTEV